MKRLIARILLACYFALTFGVSAFAAFTTTTSSEGLPYNDYKKYTYFIKEKSVTKLEKDSKEITYVYDVNVRDAKDSRILSIDTYEIKLSNLPAPRFVSQTHKFKITIEPYMTWPALTVERSVEYSYGADFSGAYSQKNWEEYKDSMKKLSSTDKYEEKSFMGRPALFTTQKQLSVDNEIRLFKSDSQNIYVYLNDITVPNGIFVLNIGVQYKADGTYDLFKDYPDFKRRLADVKNEVNKMYDQAKTGATTMLNAYSGVRVETKKTAEVRKYDDKPEGSVSTGVDTKAGKTAGESGVTIPAIIVVGVAGAAAAAAGVGAGGGTSPESAEEDKKKKYKMYIYKEFGDCIRYDKRAVLVYARIAEEGPDGTETEREDLTAQIRIFSDDSHMKVGTAEMAGRYVGATVEAESAKGSENPSEGIVSFEYIGEGGQFRNNVSFRLVGEPYIKFDEQGQKLSMAVPMIEGDMGVYKVPFSLHDFVDVPKLSIKPQENSPFEVELETTDDFNYKVIIKNRSTKSEKPNAQSSMYYVEVIAEGEDEYVNDRFRMDIYPEGLSVSVIKFDEEGYAQIGAYSDVEKVEGGEAVLATRFRLELAVSVADEGGRTKAELVDLTNIEAAFKALKGSSVRTDNLAKVFKYEIEKVSGNGVYKLQPKMQIPEGDEKHHLYLPISCEYQSKQYSLDLPVRLIGEPFNEMKEKQQELEMLLDRIKRYMPPEQWTDVIRNLKENYDNLSAKEIRLLNRSLYDTAARKMLDEAQENIDFAETLDWVIWGLEWVKWVGDQAFSYVAAAYTGPVGEALLSPTKEIMVQLISENIWYREGISSPAEKLRGVNSNLMAMLENSLMTQIKEDTSIKKAGAILAAFTVIKIVNHYYNDVGSDGKRIGFYDAILAGLGDLTSNAFKYIVSSKFDEMAGSPKAKEYFEKYVGEWVKNLLDKNADGWREKGIEVIKKYVEETAGLVSAKVYSKAQQVELKEEKGSLVININVWEDSANSNNSVIVSIDVMQIKDKLYDYIFGTMFSTFPFAQTKLNPPADPVYIS